MPGSGKQNRVRPTDNKTSIRDACMGNSEHINTIQQTTTQRKFLAEKPTTNCRNHVSTLENVLFEKCESGCLKYQFPRKARLPQIMKTFPTSEVSSKSKNYSKCDVLRWRLGFFHDTLFLAWLSFKLSCRLH